MKTLAVISIGLAIILTGCSREQVRRLGGALTGEQMTVAKTADVDEDAPVVLHGTMTKKCPVAGCWFMLTDETGTIKVDLKNSEFVVVDVPLKSKMVVAGYVVTNQTERVLEATGLRF
jgi:uncharacterized protein YdeI (BOF family)